MDNSSGVGVLDKAALVLAALEAGPATLARPRGVTAVRAPCSRKCPGERANAPRAGTRRHALVRFKRTRRDDPRARLIEDVRRTAGFMAAVIQDAERLKVTVPELAAGCVSAWRRWGRHLEGREG